MKHWREKAVKMYVDTASTNGAWKRLRILLPHTKDPATWLYVPLLWPHGTASPGVPGYDWIQTWIGKIMGTLGMEPSDLCCKVNTRAAILDRAEFLDSMNLLPRCGSTIPVHHHHILLTFFMRDDCWEDLHAYCSHIPPDMLQLQREGLHVN
eukprot:jgi/Tetstr1/429416/TSEL_019326.t1